MSQNRPSVCYGDASTPQHILGSGLQVLPGIVGLVRWEHTRTMLHATCQNPVAEVD
jgi:hypothetical protein